MTPTERAQHMSRAQEIAREAVALKVSTLDNYRKLDLVAEYAVNLALTEACKAVCADCRTSDPERVGNQFLHRRMVSPTVEGNFLCRAAVLRAMMEEK